MAVCRRRLVPDTNGNGPTGQYGVSQYGVMVRSSNDAKDPYFAAFVSPCQGLGISYRTSNGSTSTVTYVTTPPDCTVQGNDQHGLGFTSSIQVMVKRTGTSYQAYQSSGNGVWTCIPFSQTIANIPSQAPAGVFVTSALSGWPTWVNLSYTHRVQRRPDCIGASGQRWRK